MDAGVFLVNSSICDFKRFRNNSIWNKRLYKGIVAIYSTTVLVCYFLFVNVFPDSIFECCNSLNDQKATCHLFGYIFCDLYCSSKLGLLA